MTIQVRRLLQDDVEDYRRIRLAALRQEPSAFGSVHDVEAARPVAQHVERLATSHVFGAFAGSRVVGMVGWRPEDGPKDCHKGFIWGFFVEPGYRRHGGGTALVTTLIQSARPIVEQLMLSVVATQPAAIALYERFGFVQYGVEPRALKTGDSYVDEVLMVLFLRPPSPSN